MIRLFAGTLPLLFVLSLSAVNIKAVQRIRRYEHSVRDAVNYYPYYVPPRYFTIAPALVMAIIYVESRGRPSERSNKAARGVMQIIPTTATALSCRWRKLDQPKENIRCGVKYLAALLTHFRGDLVRTLSSYNAGPATTQRSPLMNGRLADNPETRQYVHDVLTMFEWFRQNTCRHCFRDRFTALSSAR